MKCAIIAAATTVTPTNASGAEIVIHVTATIDQLDGDRTTVPVALEVGTTINLTYFFDATEFAGDQTAALGSIALNLDGTVLESKDSASLVLNTGLLLPPIDPPDTLVISCSSLGNVSPACNTNRFPQSQNLIWDPTLTLFADPGSLETLADVLSLSSLSSVGATGSLRIEISEIDVEHASLERLLIVGATITQLTVVPEPATFGVAFVAMLAGSVTLRLRS